VLTTLVGAAFLAAPPSAAAQATKPFQIAAGDAAETLKCFAEQSSEQVIYPPREVHGVKTNAVKGRFTPFAALRQMLSGTPLSVLHDERTGALAIKREPDPNGSRTAPKKAKGDRPIPNEALQDQPKHFLESDSKPTPTPNDPMKQSSSLRRFFAIGAALAASITSSAQTAPKPSKGGLDEETVSLAPFEVIMTQDKGYHTPYSGSALKTNEEMMKVPQSVTVITRDMIDDIASYDLSDMLNYVAVGNFQQGDSAYVRGNNANINTDGAGDGSPSMMPDSVTIDSITIVRGPIAVLYGGNSSITGAVIRQTRVPLDKRQTTIKAQVDQYGFRRLELDATGPLGQIGEAKFSYRLDLAYQGGDLFLRKLKQDRKIAFGVVQLKYKDTTVRVNVQYQDILQPPHKNNPATPDGLPWLGAGRDEGFFDHQMLPTKITMLRGAWMQRFSNSWAFNSYATMSRYRYGPTSVLLLDQINFQREVVRYLARRNNAGVEAYNAGGDLNGKYTLFGREFRTSLGFTAWNSRRKPYDHFANPDFGSQNAAIGTPVKSSGTALGFDRIEIPFANVRYALDHIVNVPQEQYRIPAGTALGTLADTSESNVYIQQNIELIPKRLTVTGAISQIINDATSLAYTSTPTTTFSHTPTEFRNHRVLHRYGAVLNVTKNIALYAVETTNVVFINSSSRQANGDFIPPRDGIMREAGVKSLFMDEKISLTGSIYTTYFKNYAVSRTGSVIPEFGYNVFDLIKDSYIKGLGLQPRDAAGSRLAGDVQLYEAGPQDPSHQYAVAVQQSRLLGGLHQL